MARRPKSRRFRSRIGKLFRRGERGEVNSPADVVKSPEEEIMRLVLECQALLEPGKYDPKKAARLKMELDALILADQCAQQETDTEYFNWLEMNIPELFKTHGRPTWIESEKVRTKDKALLDSFEQKKLKAAADVGKKHGASKKAYAHLADESGDEDIETAKRRVMRARRRQKSLQEAIQDILGIAALAKTHGNRPVPPEESKRNREKLLEAFRRILRIK